MTDEIDVLRWYRDDTPAPDAAAWERARAAIAQIEETAEGEGAPAPGKRPPRLRSTRHRIARHRVAIAAAVAIAAGTAAGAVVTVLQGPPSLTSPLTTAWQPARPLPASGTAVAAPAGTWRLAGYLVAKGWRENTAGPQPGLLTCPTAATCYVEGDTQTSPSGPADMNSLYVSTDGTRSWSVLPVPDGVTFTSALACATATDCAAGGLYYGHQRVYLTTASGGHSWTVRPLPAGVGEIMTLDCVTATACRGLASPSGKVVGYVLWLPSDLRFAVTRDGGSHFTVVPFPAGASIQSVSCPTATHCVAVGVHGGFGARMGPDLDHGVLLTSDDGGLTWRQRGWPAGYGPGPVPTVTCADASHCAMLGFIEHDGTVGDATGYTSGKDAVQYNVIGFSADGGATWRTSTFPRDIPYPWLDALTCPTTRTCYAAGGDLIAQQIGTGTNEQSSVVAVTHDAGRTWQRVTFQVPSRVPGGMQADSFMMIGQIECPQADACIAMGISDQGSTNTPIYTNNGAP